MYYPAERDAALLGHGSIMVKIGSIVFRCYEFDKMLQFWQQALGYVPREAPTNTWVVLRDPAGRGPNLSLERFAEKRVGKRSRLHLDLYTTTEKPKWAGSSRWSDSLSLALQTGQRLCRSRRS